MSCVKKSVILAAVLLAMHGVHSQSRAVDYYGVFSPDADRNMLKMTEDLFFTQLSELDLSLNDRRTGGLTRYESPEKIDYTDSDPNAMSFYVEIRRAGDALSKWNCTIYIKDNDTKSTASVKKEYDSYYKILMESKASLKGIFTDLVESTGRKKTGSEQRVQRPPENTSSAGQKSDIQVSAENLSGTWSGEEHIDKTIIMKGGRGFIILKNGASMNVGVNISTETDGSQTVRVRQTSHSNASYFPELSRAAALEAATTAEPIEYSLRLTEENVLEGLKHTLLPSDGSTGAKNGTIHVKWIKSN